MISPNDKAASVPLCRQSLGRQANNNPAFAIRANRVKVAQIVQITVNHRMAMPLTRQAFTKYHGNIMPALQSRQTIGKIVPAIG